MLLCLDQFWKARNKCENILNADKIRSIEEEYNNDKGDLTTNDYDKEALFFKTDQIRTTFAMLTLLTRTTENGLVYGLDTNHRPATSNGLSSTEHHQKSMINCAYSSDKEVFNTNPLHLMFYQIGKCEKPSEYPAGRLVSLANETISCFGPFEKQNVQCRISNAIGHCMDKQTFDQLAMILNVPAKPPSPVASEMQLFDLKQIVECHPFDAYNSTLKLKRYVREQLKWDFSKLMTQGITTRISGEYDPSCRWHHRLALAQWKVGID